MNYRSFLTGIAAGLLLFVQTGISSVEAAIPADAPKDIKFILGFYYGNGENILIRENKGRLELLYRYSMQDKCFDLANIYPLSKNHFDSYTMVEAGPMSKTEVSVKFERDPDGYGITCRVGGNRYSRYYFGQVTASPVAKLAGITASLACLRNSSQFSTGGKRKGLAFSPVSCPK